MIGKKGQAEIMDGLILMLIAATCAVVLLSIASNYGNLPKQIYEETYAQKLAQNTLLSLYHITDTDSSSPFYRKSIMVAVSSSLSEGDAGLETPSDRKPKELIGDVLDKYAHELGWNFVFALTDGSNMLDGSIISTTDRVTDRATFKENAGNPSCASAALTYPNTGSCVIGGTAGSMCYAIFEVCVWLT